jgi:hypothetical protein
LLWLEPYLNVIYICVIGLVGRTEIALDLVVAPLLVTGTSVPVRLVHSFCCCLCYGGLLLDPLILADIFFTGLWW